MSTFQETTWVLQKNLFNEQNYQHLVDVLYQRGNGIHFVDRCAFGVAEPSIPPQGNLMIYGSTSLVKYAVEKNLGPHLYPNIQYDHRDWVNNWGYHCLNHNAKVMRLNEIPDDEYDTWFIRPIGDLKPFEGEIVSSKRVAAWRELQMARWPGLNGQQLCIVADLKLPILYETRCFVVDGKVVSSSEYRRDNKTVLSADVDPGHVEFVNYVSSLWCPDRAFVLDVAETENGPRVVEVNSINCSGLYLCDPLPIVEAIG